MSLSGETGGKWFIASKRLLDGMWKFGRQWIECETKPVAHVIGCPFLHIIISLKIHRWPLRISLLGATWLPRQLACFNAR